MHDIILGWQWFPAKMRSAKNQQEEVYGSKKEMSRAIERLIESMGC